MVILKSHAKLNLFLHVTGRTANNYHLLDSIVMFAEDLYDEIEVIESSENKIEVVGPWKGNLVGTNIIETVLEKFSDIAKIPKLHIKIRKNIPIGAGLGGGSGNAAAIIKYLVAKFSHNLSASAIMNFCVHIGADVPCCYHSGSLYFAGIGEIISPINAIPELYAAIIYPSIALSTKDVFSMTNSTFKKKIQRIHDFSDYKELWSFLSKTNNDLFNNASRTQPILSTILEEISRLKHCKHFTMTGSGSACFGMFENKESAITGANTLQKRFPEYSVYVSQLK